MWKSAIQSGLGWSIRRSGTHLLLGGFFKKRSNIIFYHRIWPSANDDIFLDAGASIERFSRDLKILGKYFEFVSLERMLSFNKEDSSTKEPLLALTFDDGFDLHAAGVSDVLTDLRIPATTFVITGCIGNGKLMWQHKLAAIYYQRGSAMFLAQFNELGKLIGINHPILSFSEKTLATSKWPMKRKEEYTDELWQRCKMPPISEYLEEVRPYFTWEGLESWIQGGNSVGLHTDSHPFCSKLDDQEIVEEIVDATGKLTRRTNLLAHTLPFSYPFGDRLPVVKEKALMDQGYFSCLLGVGGLNLRGTPPHQINRACVDIGIDNRVFGRPLIHALLSCFRRNRSDFTSLAQKPSEVNLSNPLTGSKDFY
jgi:peptidoglycan/xylan/chitin deacetylase (PgdA/CDA1 family)